MKSSLTRTEIAALLDAAHAVSQATSGAASSRTSDIDETQSTEVLLEQLRQENAQLKLLLAQMQKAESVHSN